MKVVNITENTIILDSGMNEAAFGKTNYSSIITQQGLFYNGKEIDNWTFADVKAEPKPDSEQREVVYSGNNPFSSDSYSSPKTLLEYFEIAGASTSDSSADSSANFSSNDSIENKKRMYCAGMAVCSFLTKAALDNITIPKIGAGGILVSLPEDLNYQAAQILFLPQGLYEGAVAGLDNLNFSNLQGCWINTTIFDLPSICFERAVIAYKMLTGRFPFPNANQEERNADILDRKFLPLELCVNGIDSTLAADINRALKLNSNVVNIPVKKQKGKSSEDLTPKADFPLDLLANTPQTIKSTDISDEELAQRAAAYTKAQSSKVKTKRAIRRNTTRIIIGAIAAGVFTILTINFIRTNNSNFTSVGLTSTQTIEGFFQGVNDKDPTLLDQLAKGKSARNLINTVSRIYVIGKQRKTYNADNGFASPENWIVYLKDESFLTKTGLYGVSNVKVDGNPVYLDVELHEKKDKIPPLTEEKGITLTDGIQSVHQVEYFMLLSEGDTNELTINYVTDTFTLTYSKNRWIITDINTVKTEDIEVSSAEFFLDWFAMFRKNNGDTVKSVNMLSGKYPWLPQTQMVEKEIQRQKELAENPFMFL